MGISLIKPARSTKTSSRVLLIDLNHEKISIIIIIKRLNNNLIIIVSKNVDNRSKSLG